MSEITLDVYLNAKKIGFVKSQDWYNSGRMFFVDEREENPICKGYFPDIKSYGGFDKVSFKVREQPKRSPLPDGTLELTEAELKEFGCIVEENGVFRVWVGLNGVIYYQFRTGVAKMRGNAVKIKEILWLAERFNLEEICK